MWDVHAWCITFYSLYVFYSQRFFKTGIYTPVAIWKYILNIYIYLFLYHKKNWWTRRVYTHRAKLENVFLLLCEGKIKQLRYFPFKIFFLIIYSLNSLLMGKEKVYKFHKHFQIATFLKTSAYLLIYNYIRYAKFMIGARGVLSVLKWKRQY